MKKMIRLGMLALILGGLCAAPALGAQGEGERSGRIVGFKFEPTDIEVDAGTTFEWTNTGARPHTVTDRGGTFDTGPIPPNGGTESVTLSVPGKYFFFCRINPGTMNGTIVVGETDQAKAVRVQAVDPARDGLQLGFDPDDLTVRAGTVVLFANVGGKPHSLTADDTSFDTGIVLPGAAGGRFAGNNATFVPTKAGAQPFHCEVHPDAMKGVLTVVGNAPAAPGAASTAPNRASVDIADFEFKPKELSVAAGGTVTWKNTGQAAHTATFDDEDLDTDTLDPGNEGKLVAPTKPGSYSYRCNIHPAKMRGVIVAVGQGITDPTKPAVAAKKGAAPATGPPGGVPPLALVTGVGGAFLGGFGLSAFARNKMGQ